MLLSNVLQKENNNLDIFRVIAAFMVIYGHAYAILPSAGQRDIVARLLIFDYSGSLAVKVFFFLSGLVVTNSLIERENFFHFIISRFFRLWPALVTILALWTFILGPILSTNSIQEYFSNPTTYEYFFRGLLLDIRYDLPGVFQLNAYKSVNGSLWSIPFEFYAYSFLIAIFLLNLIRSKIFFIILFSVILVDFALGNKLLFTWLPQRPEVTLLAPCFALGSLSAFFKAHIQICTSGFLGAWILFYLFKSSIYNFYFFYLAIFYSIVFLSSRDWALRLKPTIDISYGVYLWGWPLQQLMAQTFPSYGVTFNQLSTIILSIFFGYSSWHLIECRCIKMGRFFSRKLSHWSHV